MKRHAAVLAVILEVAMLGVGCSKNEQAKATAELEKAFQMKAPAKGDTQAAPANPTTPKDQTGQVQQAVNDALAAIKTNGYADAYLTLRTIQASPILTPDQVMAVQNSRLAIEKQVAERAAAGDPAALRAVEAMKQGAARR
jgi:hypothetical protein